MTKHVLNLGNHLLIAMPSMVDPNFYQTVTYICEHNQDGALGIVINRPTNIKLAEVLGQMDIQCNNSIVNNFPILFGGPVHQERGFVIHNPKGKWRSSFNTAKGITVTTSRDILQALAEEQGPKDAIVALGYAGWGAGQLEHELASNSWLSCKATSEILFHTPFSDRWRAAAKLLGIEDITTLSHESGHA